MRLHTMRQILEIMMTTSNKASLFPKIITRLLPTLTLHKIMGVEAVPGPDTLMHLAEQLTSF